MATIILCNISDVVSVINEYRQNWTIEVLQKLGVPDNIIELNDIDEYRYMMDSIGIEVELLSDGCVNIYKQQWHNGSSEETSGWVPHAKDHLVAQWKEPQYVKKVNGKECYYEIHLNEWSITKARNI